MSNLPPDPSLAALEKQFRKCSPETIRAIYDFKRERRLELVPQIVQGIARKYISADAAQQLTEAGGDVTLASLGVDSLTLMELILDVQDALDVTITDDELRFVQTLEGVSALLRSKLGA